MFGFFFFFKIYRGGFFFVDFWIVVAYELQNLILYMAK